jgi:NTP pyrophosphatase (non-canonical NTP hydrolase)
MALMVEAAELAEIFQWMTLEASVVAHEDAEAKSRIDAEVADVLLYLLQVADHCQVDLPRAVREKLAKNALKYPANRKIARVSPARASVPGTHVLLDYENVQPTEEELRALVPDACQVWVFHGPQQRQVKRRFASFGTSATAVPISKTGKNALDFHLSFYMGYIASRNPASKMVVVANDKGYEPMLEHAKAMGFLVQRQAHEVMKATAKTAAKKVAATKPPAKKVAAKRPAANAVATKKAVAKKATPIPGATRALAGNVATAKKAAPTKKIASKAAVPAPVKVTAVPLSADALGSSDTRSSPSPTFPTTVSDNEITRIRENLRKLGTNLPTKPAALRRLLKSLLGAATGDASIEVALGRLIASGIVVIGAESEVKYPTLESAPGATSSA